MDPKQAAYADKLKHYDQLDPEVREQLRTWDLDFEYIIWYQVCCLHSDNKTRLELYKKLYYQILN